MYLTYLQFCQPTSPFYEQRDVPGPEDYFPAHRTELTDGWVRDVGSEWTMYSRTDLPPPWQGWKIHVSAHTDNAERLLDVVAEYCFARGIPFKALSSAAVLYQRNSKYADRGGSGKFITIYPPTPELLANTLRGLDTRIGGEPGPTILSDLRYLDGPLYVRYGAFVSRRITDESGRQIECVEDPDGKLVPDERRPGFHPPSWAEIPDVLQESLRARGERRLTDFPYRVSRALHFSNGGGVYLAARPEAPELPVLLKEARPYCGLDESGRDAIARLETERAALTDLAGLPGVPEVDAYLDGVEHKFLARAYVEGRSLIEVALERNPFVNPDSDMSPPAFAKWAADLVGQVTETVARMHERGWVFGDLHPGNIIVDDNDRAHFIDFESASRDVDGYIQTMGVFGYRAPADGYPGRAVDSYALGCMRIGLLLPMTRLLPLAAERADDLCRAATERFGLAEEYFAGLEQQLAPVETETVETETPGTETVETETTAAPEPAAVEATPPAAGAAFTVEHLTDALHAWRTPEREDRLHPGDIRQFLLPAGGLSLAYGAAGVLWATHRCGADPDPADIEWLDERVRATPDIPVGFHSGLAGIAYATRGLAPELADHCLQRARHSTDAVQDLSLGSGLSGLGTQLLEVGDLEGAARVARQLVDSLPPQDTQITVGLLDGAAGIAVFAVRAAKALNAPEYGELAERLLEMEVSRFGFVPDQTPVSAALPALGTGLGTGALGLGLALHEHRRTTGEERFGAALRRILSIAQHTTAAHSGLLNGRLGLVQLLLALAPEEAASRTAVRRAMEEAAWYTVPLGRHRLSLGDEALKFSMDLGTGHAGLVLTEQAVRRWECALPLWEGSR